MRVLAVIILALLVLPQGVLALGIAPARTELNFEPGLTKQLFIVIYNDEGVEQTIDIYVTGPLNSSVALSTTQVVLPVGGSAKVPYTITLPANPPGEGTLDTRIGAIQHAPLGSGSAAAKVAVEAQLWVFAPYKGTKLEAALDATDVKPGEDITFTLDIDNIGISNVTTTPSLDISRGGELSDTIMFQQVRIDTLQSKTVTASHSSAGMAEGIYTATAHVPFDGGTAVASVNFSVGGFTVKILNISHTDVAPGQIARFVVTAENLWSKHIDNIFIDAAVAGKHIKSETTGIGGGQIAEIPLFWDTHGVAAGTYTARFTLHYGSKTSVKEITIRLAEGFGPLHALLILLIIILAILLLLYRRRKKRSSSPFALHKTESAA